MKIWQRAGISLLAPCVFLSLTGMAVLGQTVTQQESTFANLSSMGGSYFQQGVSDLIVTFDPPPIVDGTKGIYAYNENSVSFRRRVSSACAHADSGPSGLPDNGTGYLQFLAFSSDWYVEMGGDLFDARQVDLAEYSTVYTVRSRITFVGYKLDGSSVSVTFVTDGIIDGTGPQADFQTFIFPTTFINLVRMEITEPLFSMDNLVVASAANGDIVYHTLTVRDGRGTAAPANGSNRYAAGTPVTATVPPQISEGTNLFVCTGACVEGNAYSLTGLATVTMTLTNNATLTWLWQARPLPPTADVVLTFDPPSLPHGSRSLDNYTQSGVYFGGTLPGSYAHTDTGLTLWPNNGSAYLAVTRYYTYFDMGGQPFSLKQVDLAEYSTVYAIPMDAIFTGRKTDGSSVTATFTLDGVMDGTGPLNDFQTFTFPASFNNLTRVDFNGHVMMPSLDNLVVTPCVSVTLQTAGSPLPCGTPLPFGYGVATVSAGTLLTNRVDGLVDGGACIRYACKGWTGSGSIPASGSGSIVASTVTEDSTLTWNWQTQYRHTTQTEGEGTVTAASAWLDAGTNVVFIATPASGWTFSGWTGDTNGCTMSGNVITVSMTQARTLVACFATLPGPSAGGLVLWNRLGSEAEVRNSAAGSNGLAFTGTFVPGVFGNALELSTQNQFAVSFPANVLPRQAGCLEFWAKASDVPDSLPLGTSVFLAGVTDTRNNAYPMMHFSSNDGAANGGLCLRLGGIGSAGTGTYGNWTYTSALKGAAFADWHHYALAWSVDGIPRVTNPVRHMAVYVDGVLNTGSWIGAILPPAPLTLPENGKLGLLYLASLTSCRAAIDNLKIWDYAKTDFSDRFNEGQDAPPFILTVAGARGNASPDNGSYLHPTGAVVSACVPSPVTDGTTRHLCTGATVEGNACAQAGATNVTLTITNNATLTWNWQTQHRLTTQTEGEGAVSAADGWQNEGARVALTATAGPGWFFAGWEGDAGDCVLQGQTITVPMTRARSIQALFIKVINMTFAEFAAQPGNLALKYKQLSGLWRYSNELGGLTCDSPANKSGAAFQISVNGPGLVSFEAELSGADGTNAILCMAGSQTHDLTFTRTAQNVSLAIPAGPQRIQWLVQRGAKSPEVTGIIRNIRWTPLAEASEPVPANGQTILRRNFAGLAWSGECDYYKAYAGLTPSTMKPVGTGVFVNMPIPAAALEALTAEAFGNPIYWRIDAVRCDTFGVEAVMRGSVWKVAVLPQGVPEFEAGRFANAELTVGVQCDVGPLVVDRGLEGLMACRIDTGALPPGLRLSLQSGAVGVSGVPTRAGHYQAMLQLTLRNNTKTVRGTSLLLDIVVTALENAAGDFDGWADGSLYGEGSARLSVTPLGHITGKLSMRGTNYTFKASNFSAMTNGCCTVKTAASHGAKTAIPIQFSIDKSGAVTAGFVDEPEAELVFVRNDWKAFGMAEVLNQVAGVYPIEVPEITPTRAVSSGGGLVTLAVSSDGAVRLTGMLPGGTPVLSSGTLLLVQRRETPSDRFVVVVYGTFPGTRSLCRSIFGVFEIIAGANAGERNLLMEVIPLRVW